MQAELQELWRIVLELLNEPLIRAGTTVLAVVSAAVGIRATQKAWSVLHTHKQQILVQQLQLLEHHWQKLNYSILSDEKVAAIIDKVTGIDDVALLRERSFIRILIQMLSSAYESRKHDIMPEDTYEVQFKSVAWYFHNRADLFFSSFNHDLYSTDFSQDCERRFKQLTPINATEVRARWESYRKTISELSFGSP